MTASPPSLSSFVVATDDEDTILERFLSWTAAIGLSLYDAQEEAILEVTAGRHVILNTPTGSGKSLVATCAQFNALCTGKRAFYTSPVKALVSEKFFAAAEQLGADNVGMLTGDASINARAPIVFCTAEVLANMALRDGAHAAIDYVIMDEFHYYADPDRGMAWQVPLLILQNSRFLLMSATLGDMRVFVEEIERRTGVPVSLVRSDERPVPLDFSYRESPLHETLADLVERGLAPVYVVGFTQRECADQAQALTSMGLTGKEDKRAIMAALHGFRFDTHYGKDIKRLLSHGVGLHHAGLLPKYRLLVEKLAQRGLLKAICGTDTLGVGVNIPIRTVLFTKLCKFDGQKVRILSVRDFKQIGGRAGRKGFDDAGSVVAQAPEHVIENKRLEAKAAADPRKKRKIVRKKPPERGFVPWDEGTFRKLIESDPEPLRSRFSITHGLLLNLLEREVTHGRRDGGYRKVVDLIAQSYEREASRSRHRRHAAVLTRALRSAGIVELAAVPWSSRPCLRISEGLQKDFSLHHTLSLYLVEALFGLDPASETYAVDVMSLVESILEHPHAVLRRQTDVVRGELVARLKADGVEYEDRMTQLEDVEYHKPLETYIDASFEEFCRTHPWARREDIRPKSIARDLYERYVSFNQYVGVYGLTRSEGVLLRYVSQAYKALVQSVPEHYKDEGVHDIIAYLRTTLGRVDSSLVTEWEQMLAGPGDEAEPGDTQPRRAPLLSDPKALTARVRAELHGLVRALCLEDYEEALGGLRIDPEAEPWTEARLEQAMKAFAAEHGPPFWGHAARFPSLTHRREVTPGRFDVSQTLVTADAETMWAVQAEIDLTDPDAGAGPLLMLTRIGP